MCLIIKPAKPIADGEIRWKFVRLKGHQLFSASYAFGGFRYELNTWNQSSAYHSQEFASPNEGFHVYTKKYEAVKANKHWSKELGPFVILKLRVKGFRSSGIIDHCDCYSDGKRGEIWKEAKILQVYTPDGKKVITDKIK